MKVKFNSKDIEFNEKQSIMDYLKDNNKHIAGVCKKEELDPYGSCRLCLVNVNGKLVTACSTYLKENDVIITTNNEIIDSRRIALELMLSDHYGDCIGPCNNGCPAKSDVQGYLALAAMGKYHEAVALMKEDYILPACLGRICPAFCEKECRRNFVEEPLAIRQIKRFVADYDLANNPWIPQIAPPTGKKIAIIGGGPAGLSCAFYLRQKGHEITIFEAMPELGGMLRYGIPNFRLPKDILDKDINTILKTGINVRTNIKVGEDIEFEKIRTEFDAVFLGIGAWKSVQIDYEGKQLDGVIDAIDYLRRINIGEEIKLGQNILVVGGGHSAMDVARTATRYGSKVTLSYRRSRNEMPAENEVKDAEEEGINLLLLTNPVKIIGEDKVKEVELVRMKLGEPDESGRRRPIVCDGTNFCIEIDNVVLAIGQRTDQELLNKFGIKHDKGWLEYNKITFESNLPGVFVGGDLVSGSASVIEAIAQGKNAAYAMDIYLKGKLSSAKECLEKSWEHLDEIERDEELNWLIKKIIPYNHWKKVTNEDYKEQEKIPRIKKILLDHVKRSKNFEEIESTFTEIEVKQEAQRCMSCGCLDNHQCKLKEFSTLYGAKQDYFIGEYHKNPIDDSHLFVTLDNNKCILCERCVNLTHEIIGEGLIDNLNRGFRTKIGPTLGKKMVDLDGDFIGSFVDECPTGAFTMKTPFVKNGPWKVKPFSTVCNGCGIGCEMCVDLYKDIAINVSTLIESWNGGFICDIPRFTRIWEKEMKNPLKKNGGKFKEINVNEVKEIIKNHLEDLAIVLGTDIMIEEAKEIMKFAHQKNFKIGAAYKNGLSTAKFSDIIKSKRIKLGVDLRKFPMLKPFIHKAKKAGAILTNKNYDIAIIYANAKQEKVPTIVMHEGINEVGLIQAGFSSIPIAKNYLLIGSVNKEISGFIISMGMNKKADLILPMPKWISREGTIITTEGRKLKVNKITNGFKIINVLKTYF